MSLLWWKEDWEIMIKRSLTVIPGTHLKFWIIRPSENGTKDGGFTRKHTGRSSISIYCSQAEHIARRLAKVHSIMDSHNGFATVASARIIRPKSQSGIAVSSARFLDVVYGEYGKEWNRWELCSGGFGARASSKCLSACAPYFHASRKASANNAQLQIPWIFLSCISK